MEHYQEALSFFEIMKECGKFSEKEIEEEKKILSEVEDAIMFYGFRFLPKGDGQ
ncbi:MAG: hypothetical protein M0R48_09595 [Candidatus Omnitrophica bacterium]|jgi:hypothetical protein|nr:hypothetical protein [Candidatus Omnitrophota bacterium]